MTFNWKHDGDPDAPEPEPDGNVEPKVGQMHEASDVDFERWAEAYEDLNGAPENDDDC